MHLEVLDLLNNTGFKSMFSGGCVRDRLLGKQPKDWDIATQATPDEVITLLSTNHNWTIVPVGKQFGVVRVCRSGEKDVEIATLRTDSKTSDGRRPDSVQYTRCFKIDASRRDFTINSMFMDKEGNILDYFDGSEDLRIGIVRAVGDSVKRLEEDKLRALRALRFAATFKFMIEDSLATAISNVDLSSVSIERITSEVDQILRTRSYHVLKHIPQLSHYTEVQIPDHRFPWHFVALGCGLPEKFCRDNKLSTIGVDTQAVVNYVKNKAKYEDFVVLKVPSLLELWETYSSDPGFKDYLLIHGASEVFHVAINILKEKTKDGFLLNGNDIMQELSLKPGPEIARLLRLAYNAQLEGKVNTKQQALDYLRLI